MNRTIRLASVGFVVFCLLLAGMVQQAFCFSSHNEYSAPAMY